MNRIKLAILFSTLSFSGITLADLTTGIVAHYSFNDCTAKDISGNGYDGVIQGKPSCVNTAQGKGLYLNKTGSQGDYIVLPTFNAIWQDGFSICGTVKFQKTNRTWERIIDFGENYITLSRWGATNTLAGYSFDDYGYVDVSKSKGISNGLSKQYCFTIDNTTQKMDLFIEGKKVSETAGSITNVARTLNYIGHSYSPNDADAQGIFDDILIYNRALTTTEISQLYNASQLNGTVIGLQQFTVTCTNTTTNQTVSINPTTATDWDCKKAGLKTSDNQQIDVHIQGNTYP
jgi:hypothetical protein